ncbi:CDP-glycerol glycerophosphotransferase family protein [Lederbergia citrea]|uniref:CDP-glycerol glycerophosphotransferase family protein n=1 Tax=Lederbergia citrea TaxID=2833581 RepID=UPI001BC8DA95|nr:CDP-glycerol glycerophosphotransferase family protein [Lederbergia citrea]MBS4178104.1 CDP-glycerol glycerophosphotransferase family protein [Lederbergia citrea]
MIPTLIVKAVIRLSFFMFSFLFPINEKKVTFASYRSEKLEGNLFYIHREFVGRELGYSCYFLFKKYNSSKFGKLLYFIHLIKASYALATSRYFIVDDFYFPIYVIKPRRGMDIIQLWHAAGAFKKFGLSTIGKSFGPSKEYLHHVKIHSNYTKVYVSSKKVIPHYAEAFGMQEEHIYPLGIPRTDFFFDDVEKQNIKEKFHSQYPTFKDKKVILYAPTFRGKSHYQEKFICPIDISLLREIIGDDYVLLIHLHPYMNKGMHIDEKDKNFAFHIHGQFNTEELLTIADVLITDYSSIIFDYSLLCRPIAFFATDIDEYIKERDFYFEYQSFIPGPLFTETFSLGEWVKKGSSDLKEISTFRNEFFDYLDGKASERIVNHLLDNDMK